MYKSGSIPLGSWFGVPVRLDLLFFVVLAFQMLGSIYFGPDFVLLWFLVLGPVLLLTVLIHELGHSLAAKSVGGTVDGILLWPLGGMAFIGHTAGPKADMWIAIAGPLTHIPMIGFWVSMLLIANHAINDVWEVPLEIPEPRGWGLLIDVALLAIWMNVSLFAFNLLIPAYPLDGGRLLVDGLLVAGVSHRTTAKVTIGVAVPIALGIIALGAYSLQVVAMLIGFFILMATFDLYLYIRYDCIDLHPMFAFSPEANAKANESPGWRFPRSPRENSPEPGAPVDRGAVHAQL